MHDFMQSLQMRCPVEQTMGLSTVIIASAPIATPSVFSLWNSEMRSSSGQPGSGTPKGLFLKATLPLSSGFSFRPLEQESLPCSWQMMQ